MRQMEEKERNRENVRGERECQRRRELEGDGGRWREKKGQGEEREKKREGRREEGERK